VLAATSRRRPACLIFFVAALGATAACLQPSSAPVTAQATAEIRCVQPPLEDALAYDPGSNWFNVATSCPPSPSQLTACLQARLDALATASSTGISPVLYFSSGTYTIDQTLSLTGVDGAILVGEDPAQTVIAWAGPAAEADAAPLPGTPLDGMDPASDVGNMFHIDGSLNVKITRLTFDGQIAGSASTAKAAIRVALYQHYNDGKFRTASTANEFSDLILRHAWFGVRAGIFGGSNDAENTMRRVSFEDLSVAGFSAESDNCMNNNVWASRFTQCGVGARAIPGSLSVYDSVFLQSAEADLVKGGHQGFEFVIQGNTAIGAPTFYRADAGMANILIQNNRIAVTGSTAINVPGAQNALILDNVIQTAPPPSGSSYLPIVVSQSFHIDYPQPANHVITGNTFSAPEAGAVCAFQGAGPDFGNVQDCWSGYVQDELHANLDGGYFYGNTFNTSVAVSAPAPAPTPAAKPLIIGDPGDSARVAPCSGAPGCSDADHITTALQFLSSHCAERPILHLLAGLYHIKSTIVLPNGPAGGSATGCPIQIFGDGASPNGTFLSWEVPAGTPGADGYMFELPSPAQAVLQDLLIFDQANFDLANHGTYDPKDASGRGILVHAPDDAAGGVVYLNQVNMGAANSDQRPLPAFPQPEDNVGFVSHGVDHLNIEAEQSSFGGDIAIRIVGAGAGAQGMSGVSAAKFRGLPISAIYRSQFDVENYGNLYVSGIDAEGYTHGIRLDGPKASGRLTLTTGHIAGSVSSLWKTSPPEAGKIVVGAFSGDANLLGLTLNMPVRVGAAANPHAHVLGFGLDYWNPWVWNYTANGWVTDPSSGWWNSDGPPSPAGTVCADPDDHSPDCAPKAYPELKPQPLAAAPTYVDCATYAAWNVNNGTPALSYAGVAPSTTPYYPGAKGVFYVEGATSAGHSWFLNDSMWDWDPSDPYVQGYFHMATRCGDVRPPQAPAEIVPVIDAALEEIRKAKTAVPHPCVATTDVRVFRVTYGALAGRTGFAIRGPKPSCTQDADCALVPDVNTCQCLGVPVGTPPPSSTVECVVNPCIGHHAVCDGASGSCVSVTSQDL